MAQHDHVIANQALNSGRTDINNALSAIQSTNSGASAPASTVAYMQWLDTTNSVLKIRNSADNAWITVLKSDGVQQYASGSTAALPAFSNGSDPNTGAFFPAADTYAISTAGVERVRFDSSGNVGIGASSPANPLTVSALFNGYVTRIHNTRGVSSGDGGLEVETSTTAATCQRWLNGGTELARIMASGKVYMTSLETGSATTNIGIMATGELVEDTSSLQFKKQVEDIKIDTSKLFDIQPRSYIRKASGIEEIGLIAEELNELMPEFVGYKNNKPYSINYDKLVVPVIAEMKKLRDRIAELENA